jgi:drug/metabolite transporter (DMT)-like permease
MAVIYALVLCAAFIHASWNALIKTSKADPILAMCLLAITGGVLAVPALVLTGLPAAPSLPFALLSSLVHLIYYVLVGYCYKYASYSAIYPIFRGSAPLITAVLGFTFLNEKLPFHIWLGILVLVLGLLLLSLNALKKGGFSLKTLGAALVLACVVAFYTVLDGQGARLSHNALAYVLFSHLLSGIFMLPLLHYQFKIDFKTISFYLWQRTTLAAALGIIGYSIVLYAMTLAPIGVIAALRETSVLFAALLGWLFMGEKLGRVHFISCLIVVIGLTLLK